MRTGSTSKSLIFFISFFLYIFPSNILAGDFPKVLTCVKTELNNFDLHIITLVNQGSDGKGEAYVDDKHFNLILNEGLWLGTSDLGTQFLILDKKTVKLVSGKTSWEGECFPSDDALMPLVETISRPLSVKIEILNKELHKLKSELALIEVENSRLIEKIENDVSYLDNSVNKVEIILEKGATTQAFVNSLTSTDDLSGDISTNPEEGSLAPGRYYFKLGESRENIISKLMLIQRANIGRAWLMRSKNIEIDNPRDLLILASIIEKETGKDSERQLISSVFQNRLKKNMKLQADPTVLYGMTEGKNILARSPTREELETKNPFNTYIIEGLPVTPISNPSVSSLFAAARPSKTDFLYFVSNGSGGHNFSKTYEGHKKGIEILLTRKKEQRSSKRKGSITYIRVPAAKPILLE
jgi:uncharacterized YceG family protein